MIVEIVSQVQQMRARRECVWPASLGHREDPSHQPDQTLLGPSPITAMQRETTVEAPTKDSTQTDSR